MVTCARLAPASIDISPMAPPINSDFIIALTTSTATISTTTFGETTTTRTLKPKLAFSIDALVGDKNSDTSSRSQQCSLRPSPPISTVRSSDSTTPNYRSQTPNNETLCDVVGNSPTPSTECCRSCSSIEVQDTSREKTSSLNSQNPQNLPTGPIRPLPMQLMTNTLPQNVTPNLPHSIASASNATTISTMVAAPLPTTPTHPAQPHFLSAQFQMAAALAHQHHQQQQQQQHLSTIHLPPGHPMTLFPHMSPNPHQHMLAAPQFIRESYPLYPWFLSRHGRIFPHRFPGNFLLQPFRKPKRVRTAFSPTQLLKLEHAFEGNHYVVGAERKQLAQGLSLTETQVKVWFQNRRTKHKRMQQEGGESDTKSNKDSQSDDIDAKNNDNRSENSFEDYENVMTVDDEDENDIEEGDDEQHADDFDGQDEMIDMNEYGSDLDAVEQKKIHEQFQEQIKQHQQILLQQQYIHKDKQPQHQQQIQLQQLSQQQFINHQLHLQQYQQQKQPHQVQHE